MKLLQRTLPPAAVFTVAALVTSGLAGNHHDGLRGTIGDAAWISFVLALPVVLLLAVVLLVGNVVGKRRASAGN